MRVYDGMPPSIFANVSFMRKNGCITSEEAATMKQLISKIRDQRLRNDTTHGRNSAIDKDTIKDSLKGIMELQALLIELSDKAAEKKENIENWGDFK